jgi:hypothetical protein
MSTRSAKIKELGRAGKAGEYAEARCAGTAQVVRRHWHKSKVSRKNFGPATLALR